MGNRNWIVSANYRDRNSPYKWLVRCSTQQPEEAVAYKTVRAVNVVFRQSTEYETGFGCAVIAHAEDVVAEGREGLMPLTFAGDAFYDSKGFKQDQVAELNLEADGKMTAIPVKV